MAAEASPPSHPRDHPDSHHTHLDHLSPSNPSSPKTLRLTPSSPKKTPALPWTHPETMNLIQAYQEKWYSLKRGQLKASQWEEVAVTVAARCGYDEPSKSSTQCRHKIEKLRKRYRAEKQKPYPNSSWPFFDLMECMERGPLPISARPIATIPCQNSNSSDEDENEEEDDDDDDENDHYKSKSIDHILRGLGMDKVSRILQNPVSRKRKECFESDDEDDEDDDEDEEGEGREVVAELAAEIRAFAEKFIKMENKKMEVVRETERFRMEMENKRMEMILESQRKIADTIGRAFGSPASASEPGWRLHKKLKMVQDI